MAKPSEISPVAYDHHEEEEEEDTEEEESRGWFGEAPPEACGGGRRGAEAWVAEWDRVFLLLSTAGLFVDPLFIFVLSMSQQYMCVFVDGWYAAAVTALRSAFDAMHVLDMAVQLLLAKSAPYGVQRADDRRGLKIFGRFLFELYVILPLPQISIWIVIPKLLKKGYTDSVEYVFLVTFAFQYLPKICHTVFLLRRIRRVYGFVYGTVLWGLTLNIVAYFVASNAAGALWYLFGFQRATKCLMEECHKMDSCTTRILAAHDPIYYGTREMFVDRAIAAWAANKDARDNCLALSDAPYGYGIYAWVTYLMANVSRVEKLLFSTWWGLMCLSTFGNLEASTDWVEAVYFTAVCGSGLLLVTTLIGNVKMFLNGRSMKKLGRQYRMKSIEWWMNKRKLPASLRTRVRNHEWHMWAAMRGVDETEMIKDLPEGLRRDIKYHLCLDLVKQVPLFRYMDDVVLENICDRVKTFIFTKEKLIAEFRERLVKGNGGQGKGVKFLQSLTIIMREGDPVKRMLFIVRGHLQSSQVLRTGVESRCTLGPGNFSGDELLSWCLRRPISSAIVALEATEAFGQGGGQPFLERLPPSSSTLVTLETVEAFGLEAKDVRYITQHFRYTFMNERVRRSAQYYSPGWRTWAAVAIQMGWRRYKRRLPLVSSPNALGEEKVRVYTALLTSPKPDQDNFDF